ncbi:MAG: bifunctional alpha,alpha-trehalose-phosphate synthase (UDP-forming)/trehalose-phosphatase [Prevotella sp.]|jgi:trehalose 6-phosphate synthase/phosphatase
MKLIIVSNRLPVKAKETSQGHFEFERSEGGLATGLSSLDSEYEQHWIGWPGVNVRRKSAIQEIEASLEKMNYHPVFLSTTQYNNYYEGYSNSTLWPLCHYFFPYSQQKRKFWEAYKEVNALFCEKVMQVVDNESVVWVQDYQLMLLPRMLRKKNETLHIGYFHHIPFPSYELFRVLPERSELLEGLLGADLVAFHTHDYMRHFISAVERTLHREFRLNEVMVGNRAVHVEALPMGINYDLYSKAHKNREVKASIKKMHSQFANRKVILSVDRLDYSKGIFHRLVGFESFLIQHPEYHGKIILGMIVVPSRDKVERYAEMKRKIDERISIINGKYAQVGWTPICYYYHSFPFEDLVAMYSLADIALVSPLRDGMNLVAKEYIASKQKSNGVLILSEMAGAAAELSESILVNPNDPDQIAIAIYQALSMPEAEQKRRMKRMQNKVAMQTVNKWASDFVTEWKNVADRNKQLNEKFLTEPHMMNVIQKYQNAKRRLIMLDYDGTLVGFRDNPMDAYPTPELMKLLEDFCNDSRNKVVINSGRNRHTLEQWFGSIPSLALSAEHGACYKEEGVWHDNVKGVEWDDNILTIMEAFARKTPGAWIEHKDVALAWHYREVDPWMGMLRAKQLMQALFPICSAINLQILNGNKVVEVKPNNYSKGTEAERLTSQDNYEFVLAIGDDVTDESMFRSMPQEAITIKVGLVSDEARYCLRKQEEVIPFLTKLSKA